MQQAAAATAFAVVPSHVLGGRAQAAPSEQLNIAGIGIGEIREVHCWSKRPCRHKK